MLQRDLLEIYAEQWLGAVDAASDLGCDFVCFCGRSLDDPGFLRQANAIYDLVGGETLDGLVVWTTTLGINVGNERMTEFCRRFGALPIVSVEQPLGDAPVVVMDNRQGMYAAVSHLIEAHGRRRIAFVRGPATHEGAQERFDGYRHALADHGLAMCAELASAYPTSWDPVEAAELVGRMFADGRAPDAVVAANDGFAVGALSALAARGVRVPEEVSVVGFDDLVNVRTDDLGFDSGGDDEAAAVRRSVNLNVDMLSLTTVRAPFRELGRRSVEVVLALIRGANVPSVTSVATQLVVRHSCGCRPAALSPALSAAPDAALSPASEAALDTAVRQGDLATRLRRALTHRSSVLPPDWPERLCAAFDSELRGRSRVAFLGLLDGYVRTSLRHGESADNWSRALSALSQLAGLPGADRADTVRLQALTLLNDAAERYRRYGQLLAVERSQVVRQVGRRLVAASDIAELTEILAGELPKVGIPGCYLATYEPTTLDADQEGTVFPVGRGGPVSRVRSRLLFAYENNAATALPADCAVFPSVRLVPGDRLRRASAFSMVAVPLYVNDEQLGFALFELGPRIGWIYAALREDLSTAVHCAVLVEREHAARAALVESHRREERYRLAGDLHDSVSQALFSMTLHIRALQLAVERQDVDSEGPVGRGLVNLRELTQTALTEMRALIFQLRPAALHDEGLVAAIRTHAAAVAAREGFEVGVHAPAQRLHLGAHAEAELFRIVQEALHNSVKHAGPGHIDIRLHGPVDAAGTLVVEVADDGVGFDPSVPHPGHLGLETMRERAERLGGLFTVDSSPAGSTTIRVVLPGILRQPA
jgi:signal transduction histidine kinase/DNA-binding LacI/PurR family transcriptional regulator